MQSTNRHAPIRGEVDVVLVKQRVHMLRLQAHTHTHTHTHTQKADGGQLLPGILWALSGCAATASKPMQPQLQLWTAGSYCGSEVARGQLSGSKRCTAAADTRARRTVSPVKANMPICVMMCSQESLGDGVPAATRPSYLPPDEKSLHRMTVR